MSTEGSSTEADSAEAEGLSEAEASSEAETSDAEGSSEMEMSSEAETLDAETIEAEGSAEIETEGSTLDSAEDDSPGPQQKVTCHSEPVHIVVPSRTMDVFQGSIGTQPSVQLEETSVHTSLPPSLYLKDGSPI